MIHPAVKLELKEADGKKLVLLHVYPGQETPYYYIGDKQRLVLIPDDSRPPIPVILGHQS